MARLEGKTVFITGAGSGMGQSHAVMMAREGANIIAVDLGTERGQAGLAETAGRVEAAGGKIVTAPADVRSLRQLQEAVDGGVAHFGGLDVVVANAAISIFAPVFDQTEEQWTNILETNLRGTWATCKAASPHLEHGSSIVLIGSTSALKPAPGHISYSTSKHGLVGMMRTMMVELAPRGIRVNAVHPGLVDTPMLHNPTMYQILTGRADATREEIAAILVHASPMGQPWVDCSDVSHAVIYLSSEEARLMNGVNLPVDMGFSAN